MSCKVAIFDMDGTILNTIEDLGDSLNAVLEMNGHKGDWTAEDAGRFFGSGVRVACQRALAKESGMTWEELALIGTPDEAMMEGIEEAEIDVIEKAFSKYYPEHCAIKTRPFDGIPELLEKLSADGVKLAVASNKINVAVQELAELHFNGFFDMAIGVDDTIRRKPHPDMLVRIMEEFGASADETVLVGDTEIDMMTAGNAGVRFVCVDWGFRTEDYMRSCGVDEFARTANDIDRLLKRG